MKKILFVCTGNTCRSSMAEAIATNLIKQKGLGDRFIFTSAGTWALDGSPASENAVEALKAYNIDLSSHRAQRVNQDIVNQADLILTMTAGHKAMLQELFPASLDKLYTLYEYLGDTSRDVDDPFGGSLAVYEESAAELKSAVEELLKKLI
jgi:protein-tyrosine-phosphatase